jgi:hypothetical protein
MGIKGDPSGSLSNSLINNTKKNNDLPPEPSSSNLRAGKSNQQFLDYPLLTDRESIKDILGALNNTNKEASKDYISNGPTVKHKVTRRLIHTSGNLRGPSPPPILEDRKLIDRVQTNEFSEKLNPNSAQVLVKQVIISNNKLIKNESSSIFMSSDINKTSVNLIPTTQ